MATNSIAVQHYVVRYLHPRTGEREYATAVEDLDNSLASTTRIAAPGTVPEVELVERILRLGQHVQVSAFGGLRHGTITKIGRKNITVEFVRNQQGGRAERSFPPHEVISQSV